MFSMDLGINFALHNIIRLVFITELESVYCAVRTESLYITQIHLVFKRLIRTYVFTKHDIC